MQYNTTMTLSFQIMELVVARFLCKRSTDLTWIISPKAVDWAVSNGVAISRKFSLVPSDEWRSFKDLSNHEKTIHDRHEYFSEVMTSLVEALPGEVERFTYSLNQQEFRIILVYGGQVPYDFFARDHRFGAPPRGKVFRSNVRGEWRASPGRKRPDVAVVALKRKIEHVRAMGSDTSELEIELARRQKVLDSGGDPMEGVRKVPIRHESRAPTPEEAVQFMRSAYIGPPSQRDMALAEILEDE